MNEEGQRRLDARDTAGAQRVEPECGHDFDGLVRSLGNAHDLAERQAAEIARLEARLRAVEADRQQYAEGMAREERERRAVERELADKENARKHWQLATQQEVGAHDRTRAEARRLTEERDAMLVHHRAAAEFLEEHERLREELEDSNATYRAVMDEACAGGVTYSTDDRLHCTCVPHLREGVKALRELVQDIFWASGAGHSVEQYRERAKEALTPPRPAGS